MTRNSDESGCLLIIGLIALVFMFNSCEHQHRIERKLEQLQNEKIKQNTKDFWRDFRAARQPAGH